MVNVHNVMNIGIEKENFNPKEKKKQKKKQKKKSIHNKFINWIICVMISFIPLLIWPIYLFIDDGNFYQFIYNIFCDISIIFAGISCEITSLNDFMHEFYKKGKNERIIFEFLLIVLGACLYGAIIVKIKISEKRILNYSNIFILNITYFTMIFLVSISKYINKIVGGEN